MHYPANTPATYLVTYVSKVITALINTRTGGDLNLLERRSWSKLPIHVFFICFASGLHLDNQERLNKHFVITIYVSGIFAEGIFDDEIFAEGYFAGRKFRRTEFSPNGIFPERNFRRQKSRQTEILRTLRHKDFKS